MVSKNKGLYARFTSLFKSKSTPTTDREAYIAEQEAIGTPWATFEVTGFENDGRVKVEFNWNDAFITKLNDLGFQAETEEDSVQLFFYAAQLRPTELSEGDASVQSDSHPSLSANQNIIRT